MNFEFELTEEQQTLLKEQMGIEDLSKMKIIFEVDSMNTKGVKEEFSMQSSSFSVKTCKCPSGGWSPLCCRDW